MVPPPWQGRREEWREGGGSCPPMGELGINLVALVEHKGSGRKAG